MGEYGLIANIGNNNTGYSSQSVADYLVASIKPNVEVIRERFKGMTINKRIYSLFPASGQSGDIISFTKRTDTALIEWAGQLPSWFDKSSYIAKSAERIQKLVSSDRELSQSLKRLEKKSGDLDEAAALSYSSAFEILSRKMREAYTQFEYQSAFLFLKSDIPTEYFDSESRAQVLFLAELGVLHRRSELLESQLHMVSPRGFAIYKKTAENFKRDLSPLMAAGRLMSESSARLDFFVRLSTASAVEEMFHVRPLIAPNLNKERFQQCLKDLENASMALQHELLLQRGSPHAEFELSEASKDLQRSLANTVIL